MAMFGFSSTWPALLTLNFRLQKKRGLSGMFDDQPVGPFMAPVEGVDGDDAGQAHDATLVSLMITPQNAALASLIALARTSASASCCKTSSSFGCER